MYVPKFKEGDAIIRKKESKITFDSIKNKTVIIESSVCVGTSPVSYYLFKPEKGTEHMDHPLIPAIDVDKNYIIDERYYRKDKLSKIIYNINDKETI